MDYLLSNYYFIFYVTALVLSIARYPRYFNSVLKYLPILFTYTLLSELLGMLVRDVDDIQLIYRKEFYNYNTVIFNIFDIIFYLYFFYVFYELLSSTTQKAIIKYGGVVFLIVCLINLWFQDFYTAPQNYAIIFGSLILLFCTLSYLKDLISKVPSSHLIGTLLFWISIGLIIFYSCYPITMYLLSFHYDVYINYGLSNLHYATIAAMYTCFIIGFMAMKRATPKYGWQ